MEDQDLQCPNIWSSSPEVLCGAGILPAVKSLPILFAPFFALGVCVLWILRFVCAGRSQHPSRSAGAQGQWFMAQGQGSSPLSTLPANCSLCQGESILRAPKKGQTSHSESK